ncbi:MAG: flippase [Nitrospirae bacterium]|nr:flippase [Nitrospirota bacterium]
MTSEDAGDLRRLAGGAVIALAGSAAGKALLLACQVMIARLFGAEAFGMYVLGLAAFKVAELLSRGGLGIASLRFISMNRGRDHARVKGTLISGVGLSFAAGVVFAVILYASAGLIAGRAFHMPELTGMIRAFAPGVPLMAASLVIVCAVQGFQDMRYAAYIKDVIQPGVCLSLVAAFAGLGLGPAGAAHAMTASYAVALAAALYFVRRLFPALSDPCLRPVYATRELVSTSVPLMMGGVIVFLLMWTDTIMLGLLATTEDVGIYRAASQPTILLLLFQSAANAMYAPMVSEAHARGNSARMAGLFGTATRWVFYLALPAALVLISSADAVVSIFGPEFVDKGAPVLVVLTAAQLVNVMTGGVAVTINMTGRQKLEFYNSLAMFAVNLVLNLLLVPRYGVIGAAAATGVSIALVNLVRLAEVYYIYRMHPYDIWYAKLALCGAAAGLALLTAGRWYSGLGGPATLALNVSVVAAVFAAFAVTVGFPREERYVFEQFRAKVFARCPGSGASSRRWLG